MHTTMTKTRINKKVTFGSKNKKTPKLVATPFPPLKAKKNDKLCPKITISATMERALGESPPALAKATAKKPLKASANNTMIPRSEEHTSELQSRQYLVCRLLLEKKKNTPNIQLA